ncbi:MAG: hypothetical protein Q4D81_00425 [Eubacteriales bacterium]|nr:hypothetical protein [Eubacteriales bacterium]
MGKQRKHRSAYQKACMSIEIEGRKQCMMLYGAAGLALRRHHNKGRQAILNLFDLTGEIWRDCAKTNKHSMIEMCYRETGIEIQRGDGKSWEDLPYLNASLDMRPMSNAQMVYMRQQQVKWVAPQVMACIMVALHRKYGFGFDRCARVYSQIDAIRGEYGNDPEAIREACRKETGINVEDVYTRKREVKAVV